MYVLLHSLDYLGEALDLLQNHYNIPVKSVTVRTVSRERAEVVYNNFRNSPYYERAVSSLLGPPAMVAILLIDLPESMDIADFKRVVQGSYGTTELSTIRGRISARLRNWNEGYVHVPDSVEKAHEDLRAFDMA